MTSYLELSNWKYIQDPKTYLALHTIYQTYCKYKQFESVMPLFDSQFSDPTVDVIGYYNNNQIVAFSILKKYDDKNVEALQFAWDYVTPKLRLGILSLQNECAIYKKRGFKNLYLGLANTYKSQLAGFEILGKIT